MTNSNANPAVDPYFVDGCGRCPLYATPECKVNSWQPQLAELRRILLETDLTEELKWSFPCYTYDGNNVVMLSALKGYCVLGFFKGVLLKDAEGVLIQQTENMQADRQLQFKTVGEIREMEPTIKALVAEAIEVEKAGLKVQYKSTSAFEIPDEFQVALDENPALKAAFEALTPGRQRGYILYFAGAKQSKTRTARVERYTQKILDGKGFHD